MATYVNLGTAQGKGVSSLAITTAATVPAGSVIFIVISYVTNSSTNAADSNLNAYSPLGGVPVSSSAGIEVRSTTTTSALASGSTITVNWALANGYAISAFYMSAPAGQKLVYQVATSNNSPSTTSTAPTVTLTGLTSTRTYALVGVVGTNGPNGDAFTQATNWATPPNAIGTTGGNAATNYSIRGGTRDFTGGTSVTYAPTLGNARTWGAMLFAFVVGNILTGSASESGAATDAETTTVNFVKSIGESVTATAAQTLIGAFNVDITEAATATDAETAAFPVASDITESVTATDAETAALSVASDITESVTATDSETSDLIIPITESVTATDAETAALSVASDITESVTATDAETAALSVASDITESVTATETEDAAATFASDITESVTATDTEEFSFAMSGSIAEASTAVDTIDQYKECVIAQFEPNNPSWPINTYLFINDGISTPNAGHSYAVTFIAPSNMTIAAATFGVVVEPTGGTASTTGAIEIWQLASNSISSTPNTLIATTPVTFSSITTDYFRSLNVYYFSSPVSLTAGVGYAVVFRAGSDWTTAVGYLSVPVITSIINTAVVNIFYNSYRSFAKSAAGSWNVLGFYPMAALQPASASTDTGFGGLASIGNETESATAVDSSSIAFSFDYSQSESVTAAEVETANYAASVTNTEAGLSAADSQNVYNLAVADKAESISAADSPSVALVLTYALTEAISATEVEYSQIPLNVVSTESSSSLSEASASSQSIDSSRTEAVTATDSYTVLATFVGSLLEVLASTDSSTGSGVFGAAAIETVTVADTTEDNNSSQKYVSQQESGSGADALADTLSIEDAVVEARTAADEVTGAGVKSSDQSESITAVDNQSAIANMVAARLEQLAATDIPFVLPVFAVSVQESVTSTDSVSDLLIFVASNSESVTAQSIHTGIVEVFQSVLETTTANATVAAIANMYPQVVEISTATASAVSGLAYIAQTSEVLVALAEALGIRLHAVLLRDYSQTGAVAMFDDIFSATASGPAAADVISVQNITATVTILYANRKVTDEDYRAAVVDIMDVYAETKVFYADVS